MHTRVATADPEEQDGGDDGGFGGGVRQGGRDQVLVFDRT